MLLQSIRIDESRHILPRKVRRKNISHAIIDATIQRSLYSFDLKSVNTKQIKSNYGNGKSPYPQMALPQSSDDYRLLTSTAWQQSTVGMVLNGGLDFWVVCGVDAFEL